MLSVWATTVAVIAADADGSWTAGSPGASKPSTFDMPKSTPPSPALVRFASSQSDNMVLQQAPASATVWGFAPPGETVTVTFNGQRIAASTSVWLNQSTWLAKLPPTSGSLTERHTVTAQSRSGTASLANVSFGEVWVCSGQSNMAYPLGSPGCWNASNINCTVRGAQCSYGCVNNSGVEVEEMANYPHMRLYQNVDGGSTVPLPESTNSGWQVPPAIGGKFSAMCWFFGRDLYAKLSPQVPVGLIETNVGGTPDQHWSSPDALAQCTQAAVKQPWGFPNNIVDSVLWNGKVVPLTRNVVKGVVWMQGERNSHDDGRQYNCSLAAMISDWRSKWTEGTAGASDPAFPFGWSQLNSNGKATDWSKVTTTPVNATAGDPLGLWAQGFPSIRLAESTTLALPNTFQAVILDTPVASGSVHSPYKQPAGDRLLRGALGTAYGQPQQDVAVGSVSVHPSGAVVVTVSGMSSGQSLQVRAKMGFEVFGGDKAWHAVPIVSSTADSVTLEAFKGATAVRYLWTDSPCTAQPYLCAVYAPVVPLGDLSGQLDFVPLGPFARSL